MISRFVLPDLNLAIKDIHITIIDKVTLAQAVNFIRPAIPGEAGIWADIGAGTGVFTRALFEILNGGEVYAVDKSPHALWKVESPGHVDLHILEADFSSPLDLPLLDGIIMANALHYVPDPLVIMQDLLSCLRPSGRFILIEYDLNVPRHPWIPYPIPYDKWTELSGKAGLSEPEIVGERESIYDQGRLYCTVSHKL